MSRVSRAILSASLVCLTSLSPAEAWCAIHLSTVEILHSPDGRECTFFRLAGVGEADPVKPANPWFAVSKALPGYWEIFAMITKARLNGLTVRVHTSGQTACNEAAVIAVEL